MVELYDELRDKRDNAIVLVVDIKYYKKGALYTVKYNENKYRRYYEKKLTEYFSLQSGGAVEHKEQNYKNVVFLDFANKDRFANYKSWAQWLKLS